MKRFSGGELIKVESNGNLTLYAPVNLEAPPTVREMSIKALISPEKYKCIEGKAGLIVYVAKNRLGQPLGYRVLIEGHELFCKATVADKYFKLVGYPEDESRRSGPF